jgi:hypothetical protein
MGKSIRFRWSLNQRRQARSQHEHKTQQHEQTHNNNPSDSVQLVRFNVSHHFSPDQILFADPGKVSHSKYLP